MRYLVCALISLLLLPASAIADSITVDPGPSVAEYGTSTTTVTVDTSHADARIEVVAKPVSQGECRPSYQDDYAAAGGESSNGSRLTIADQPGASTGTYRFDHTWQGASDYYICAWLAGNYQATYAAAGAPFSVHRPSGTLTVSAETVPNNALVHPGGIDLNARITARGESEAKASLWGFVIRQSAGSCPGEVEQFSDHDNQVKFGDPVSGSFVKRAIVDGELLAGVPYRACVYMNNGSSQVAAAAVDFTPVTKPVGPSPLVHVPSFPIRAGQTVRCDNYFVAWPARLTLAYRWFRNGSPLSVHTRRYKLTRADRGKRIACEVTASNSVGTKRQRSRAIQVTTL